MSTEELKSLIESVGASTGIALSASFKGAPILNNCEFRIRGLEAPDGFALAPFRTALGVGLKTKWDLFSADLIKTVETFHTDNPAEVEKLQEAFPPEVTFMQIVNGNRLSSEKSDSPWKALEFQWITPLADMETSSEWEGIELLLETSVSFLFDVISADVKPELAQESGEIEGFANDARCGGYSRSATNRKACLKHFGYICVACGLKPTEKYGPDGSGVIHVHHLTPLSKMAKPSPVSPVEDLVPLCANCHNFAHKKSPPYTPEEIREGLKN